MLKESLIFTVQPKRKHICHTVGYFSFHDPLQAQHWNRFDPPSPSQKAHKVEHTHIYTTVLLAVTDTPSHFLFILFCYFA